MKVKDSPRFSNEDNAENIGVWQMECLNQLQPQLADILVSDATLMRGMSAVVRAENETKAKLQDKNNPRLSSLLEDKFEGKPPRGYDEKLIKMIAELRTEAASEK